jgi:putative ABC transport system permease protein
MIRITFAQMRRSLARLTAAGIAIVIGTAFVAATLLAGNLITRAAYDSIAAQYAQADLVIRGAQLVPDYLETIRATPGVSAADLVTTTILGMRSPQRTVFQAIIPAASDDRLMPLTLTEGRWPTVDGEIALPPSVAERLRVGVGDVVDIPPVGGGRPAADAGTGRADDAVAVVGIVDDPRRAYSSWGGAAVMLATDLAARSGPGGFANDAEVAIMLADPAAAPAVGAALVATLTPDAKAAAGLTDADPSPVIARTPDELAQESATAFSGGADLIFLIFVLTFASIALLVAGLVISNTFQVLVAPRTRTLALLRAIGAAKGQVGRSVVVEAALLGFAASVAGVLVGCGLGQIALLVAGGNIGGVFLPEFITVTWPVVVIPVAVGTLVTVLAALVPARMATRVAPLAALRPIDGPSLERGSSGVVRLVLSVLAIVFGGGLLLLGTWLGASYGDQTLGILAGIAGGAISFVGLAVSAVFWLPRVAAVIGRMVGHVSATARLAAANTLRNPRRTAATSTALLIGVTLVTMMSTGAASARAALANRRDGVFYGDVQVSSTASNADGTIAPIPDTVIDTVAGLDGVAAVAPVLRADLTITSLYDDGIGGWTAHGEPGATPSPVTTTFFGVDPGDAQLTLADPRITTGIAFRGAMALPESLASQWGLTNGDVLQVAGPNGTLNLSVEISPDSAVGVPLLDDADLKLVVTGTSPSMLWVHLDGPATATIAAIEDTMADIGAPVVVQGTAVERATFDGVINTVLGIVVGLLAVAVIIALIGVANTLSLSVLERRRESATLRAIGATRGQLRRMLAIEGMLIAGVGAVLGIVLGLGYGWAGSLAALGGIGPVSLTVPWRDVALVAVVSLVAGLVASVGPARSAVRPSPVVALAAE